MDNVYYVYGYADVMLSVLKYLIELFFLPFPFLSIPFLPGLFHSIEFHDLYRSRQENAIEWYICDWHEYQIWPLRVSSVRSESLMFGIHNHICVHNLNGICSAVYGYASLVNIDSI